MRGLWGLELALLVLAVMCAAWLRFHREPHYHLLFVEQAPVRALLVALCITGAMLAFGLYQVHVRHRRAELLLRLTLSFAFGGITLLVIYYVAPQAYLGRGVLALSLLIGAILITTLRFFLLHAFVGEGLKQRVLVYGAGANADLINSRLRRQADRRSFVLVGFVEIEGQDRKVGADQLVAAGESMQELVRRLAIDEVVIAPEERRGALPMEDMLRCVQEGVAVTDLSTFFEREAGLVHMSVADPSWLVFSTDFGHSAPRRLSKRFFDLAAASALLLLTWPIMLCVAAGVWLTSGAPVLYRQVRVGEGGREFVLVKFRSMRVDAESDGVARWAQHGDDRSTRFGRFLRMTRLDELPQIFSVLAGHMSFVGPRPERPHFVDMLNEQIRFYGVRHSVKPGITGWAQLRYPYGASVRDADEKLKFDLFYVKNHGLLFDLMIMIQTVEVVMFGRGAR